MNLLKRQRIYRTESSRGKRDLLLNGRKCLYENVITKKRKKKQHGNLFRAKAEPKL